jgi:anti-anti-sigma regulatory factor
VTLSASSSCESVVPPRSELAITRVFWPLAAPSGSRPGDSVRLAALVDLDLASERRARQELAPLCSGGGDHQRIIVTIGERCFVDVRGLAVLIDAARAARRRHRELVVIAGSGPLRACVDALGLHAELRVVDAPAEAC